MFSGTANKSILEPLILTVLAANTSEILMLSSSLVRQLIFRSPAFNNIYKNTSH
jgi:hypothetical protein